MSCFQLPLSGSRRIHHRQNSPQPLFKLSTPSLGITRPNDASAVPCQVDDFQLPLSGSRSHLFLIAENFGQPSELSTPSLGITGLTGTDRGPVEPFNSLSRDHFEGMPFLFSTTPLDFQLPLSGSLLATSSTGQKPRSLSTPSLGITKVSG